MNERSTITVSLGRIKDDLTDIELIPFHPEIAFGGNGAILVSLTGFTNKVGYQTESVLRILKGNSSDIIKTVGSKHFKVDSNVVSSDNQPWIQPNTTDKSFIYNLWLHSNCRGVPVIAITEDSRLLYRDLKTVAKEAPALTLESTSSEISYDPNYNILMNSGFFNSWEGYGKRRVHSNITSGVITNESPDITPLLSLSKIINQRDFSGRIDTGFVQSDNNHAAYYNSFQKNMANLASLSSMRIELTVMNIMLDVDVLDLVMFKDVSLENRPESQEDYSGLYFISKKGFIIQRNKFKTIIDLCRESMNSVRS